MTTDDTALHLPAQIIPVPKSLSPEAQGFLADAAKRIAAAGGFNSEQPENPRVLDGAEKAVEFMRPLADGFKGSFETIALPSRATLYRATPDGRQGRLAEVAFFDIHGGGFITGGGDMCRLITVLRAVSFGAEVFSVDYRLLPDHPYPAGLDDCVVAYREVLKHYDAASVVVGGASAGGNLAAALMLRAIDEGLPLPAALILLTPAVDITCSGDSYQTNKYLDVNLTGGTSHLSTYAGSENPECPYVSPLFGDFSRGWPPTLLTTGTRDILLSDTVRLHRALRRAGINAELHVTEAGPHGGFMGVFPPEDMEILEEARRFVYSAWRVGSVENI